MSRIALTIPSLAIGILIGELIVLIPYLGYKLAHGGICQ